VRLRLLPRISPMPGIKHGSTHRLLKHQQALKVVVDQLYSLIDPRRAVRLDLTLQSTLLRTNNVDELETVVQATQQSGNKNISAMAKTKALCIQHEDIKWVTQMSDSIALHRTRSALTCTTTWQGKSIGEWNGQRVLVEWKSFSPELSVEDSKSRISGITSLLHLTNESRPRDLMIPWCIGSVQGSANSGGDRAAGILYDIHASCPEPAMPESLLDRLEAYNKAPNTVQRPPLEARLRLARALAHAVYSLHGARWLHKGLRPGNIIFFPPASSSSTTVASVFPWHKPQLIGFDYARPADQTHLSEDTCVINDLYRHPSVQGVPRPTFVPAFDLFALGLILLEIGCWEMLGDVQHRYLREQKLANLDEARRTLHRHLQDATRVRGVMRELAFLMGTRYQEAVRSCLLVTPESYSAELFRDVIEKLATPP
jgi:hypothetical protein